MRIAEEVFGPMSPECQALGAMMGRSIADVPSPDRYSSPASHLAEEIAGVIWGMVTTLQTGYTPPTEQLVASDLLKGWIPSDPIWPGRDFTVEKGLVFAVMPFSDEGPYRYVQQVYQAAVKPLLEEDLGLRIERADDIYENRAIMSRIWHLICKAELVVADFTGRNPNVFYEMGIAHTLGKRWIHLTQNAEDIPFDLRHLPYIKYDAGPNGVAALRDGLRGATIQVLNLGMPVAEVPAQ